MISTILLPPEDTVPENIMHTKAKDNPYFKTKPHENWHKYQIGSMINNYQQVAENQFHRFLSEREMLSSQYSSVASTIAPEKPKIKESSPSLRSLSNSNHNFMIRNKGHKRIKVPAKLRNFFGTNTT